ncbi:hypothetical protein SPRG_08551 [Saprolegnia parasitica CBS 223.65]|uniref:FYVE zinc finger domain-containing protein n=1 Tax=Saprolegnia parasitica (strain CBS 223.65) TaxID=695850 RepID=A0A067C626_SAPPC|nr:hypothetical protein SPRG_08551 [Saprolegnia parasitica CBS 223.65]KDO26189.1 hypothetical protein SPRG_08551 [Saprolegnia parasitica CBS 223.65]|eukprot:XP_012203182.1 hypothetical protein SPRG_08551 [Saprolegnia parasitica CBS 223.65]
MGFTSCGNVVCSHCAKSRRPVYGLLHAHRVCDECVVNGVWTDPRDVRAGIQLKKEAARDELSRVKLELDSVRSRLHELDASPANAPPPGPPH